MLKVLDRYIIWSLIQSFVICLVGMLALYILIDGFEKLEDFIDYYRSMQAVSSQQGLFEGAGSSLVGMIFQYYLIRVPVIYIQVAPVIMLLASTFTMTRMVRHNEMVPLHASGVSLYRIMLPHLVLAIVCALSMIAVQELVIPRLSRRLNQAKVLKEGDTQVLKAVQTYDSSGRVFYFGWIFPFKTTFYQVRVLERYAVGGRRASEVDAHSGRWQRVGDKLVLVLSNGVITRFHPKTLTFMPGYPKRFGKDGYVLTTDFKVSALYTSKSTDMEMFTPARELMEKIRSNPLRYDLVMSLHMRLAMPLATLILLIIGAPLIVARETQSFFLGVGICILVAAAYYVSLFVMINLGNKAILAPHFAAWAPVIVFGSLGLAILDGART